MSSLFGTDGIRGVFGSPPIDADTVTRVGWALGDGLRRATDGRPPLVVLGGDTRDSTPEVASWVETGLVTAGAEVANAGVVPTPAVAALVLELGAGAGVSISASHNPWCDNGVKLFDALGFKWSQEDERRLEARLGAAPAALSLAEGTSTPEPALGERYLARLLATLPSPQALAGLRVAIDAANGAASPWARRLFESAGARVEAFHDRPDGVNINVGCGSTTAAEIARLVRETGSDLGVAFDGDADRCMVADETGRVLDGDAILFLLARARKARGTLDPAMVVVTEMSNLGLDAALAREGIAVVRCGIGDREVVEEMRRRRVRLGGEQSGHLVNLDLGSTGDGLLSALQVALLAAGSEAPLSRLAAPFETFPQTLQNVVVRRKERFDDIPGLPELLSTIRGRLGDEGRVLLRYSGTEPLARIMIEGRDQSTIQSMASQIAETLERHLS
ncbi:MAG TPA: phosphoglucosamine mutase [Thermoanaerobaculia bacterium]|nr:phosphoglucosamine mutase [Thermoanaerobaculia bacterium]